MFVSGNKPHACHICPKRFALACNLRAHLKTHQDDDGIQLTMDHLDNMDSTSSPLEEENEEEQTEELITEEEALSLSMMDA